MLCGMFHFKYWKFFYFLPATLTTFSLSLFLSISFFGRPLLIKFLLKIVYVDGCRAKLYGLCMLHFFVLFSTFEKSISEKATNMYSPNLDACIAHSYVELV